MPKPAPGLYELLITQELAASLEELEADLVDKAKTFAAQLAAYKVALSADTAKQAGEIFIRSRDVREGAHSSTPAGVRQV